MDRRELRAAPRSVHRPRSRRRRRARREPAQAAGRRVARDLVARRRYRQDGAEVRLPLVLRRDPGSTTLNTQRHEEFRVQQAAFAAGVPVPRPYWLADGRRRRSARRPSHGARRGRDAGAPPAARRRVRRRARVDDRRSSARSWRASTASTSPRHGLDFLAAPPAGESPAPAELDRYEQIFRGIAPEPHPAFELAFRWLRQRLPDAARRALVHGDYRIGNVIFGPEGVRAILDWELAHIGDPAEDLGWLCVRAWRFGSDDKPVGGIGTREDAVRRLRARRRRAGRSASACASGRCSATSSGRSSASCRPRPISTAWCSSVELASLGRRTAETELELLELIQAR